jgi:hypothetical protein
MKDWMIATITTIALALGGFALEQVYQAHADIAQMREQLSGNNARRLDDHDEQLKMLWTYTGWLHYEVNDLRSHAAMPVAVPPDLHGSITTESAR